MPLPFAASIGSLFTKTSNHSDPYRLSIPDMLAMDDEELGREFRKHGEWYRSNEHDHSVFHLAIVFLAIGMMILTVSLFFLFLTGARLLYHKPIGGSLSLCIAFLILTFLVLKVFSNWDFNRSTYGQRAKYKYDMFDVLKAGHGKQDPLDGFIGEIPSSSGSLLIYKQAISGIVAMYRGHDDGFTRSYSYRFSDDETGRMLRLILPVAYMMVSGVALDDDNYSILDRRTNLTEQAIDFRNAIVDKERLHTHKVIA